MASIFYGPESEVVARADARDIGVVERIPAVLLLAALIVVGFCPQLLTSAFDATLSNVASFNNLLLK